MEPKELIMITSLTNHRIDVLFAEYIKKALGEVDYLIVTNGMYDNAKIEVLQQMKTQKSLYLIDDHTCWVPNPDEYPLCKILSQFTSHPTSDVPMDYFQVSELALFDLRFDTLKPRLVPKGSEIWGYWGQYKPERLSEYKYYLSNGTKVIGRRYPPELESMWDMLPFQKDMNSLHTMIALFTHTKIFGDKLHNGINIPYRIYEALMCGVHPVISRDLIGIQSINIDWALMYLEGDLSKAKYIYKLNHARESVVTKLKEFMMEEDAIVNILKDRATIYGSYSDGIDCRANILQSLNDKHIQCNGHPLPEDIRIVFSDIILKLMRGASDPTHLDSWLDLAGYSKLIYEMMEERQNDSRRH